MSRFVKELIVDELRRRYGSTDSALVVSLIGMNGNTNHAFRARLREMQAEVHVVPNRLARRAFAETPLAPLGQALEGPCALVTGGPSIVDVAKELVKLREEFPQLELKRGMIEGDPDLMEVERIAKLRSKAEIQSEVAAIVRAPAGRISGAVRSAAGRIAGCIQAIVERLERGETIAAAG